MTQIPACDEYVDAISVPKLVKASCLQGGKPVLFNGLPEMYTGGYCVVFPFIVNGKKQAVRCWHAYLPGSKDRCREISGYLEQKALPYFAKFQFVENGIVTRLGVQPIVVMDWIEGLPLKEYIEKNIQNKSKLLELAEKFKEMVHRLHENCISHGDLQHGNIIVKEDGVLMLVDYDSLYVPSLDGYTDEIHGLKGYQHPARFKNKSLSPKADYFSELIIYTSILALAEIPEIWEELRMEYTDTLVFSAEDIDSRGHSQVFERLRQIPKTKNLINRICLELNKNSIDDLSPLEENCISIMDSIRNDFADNGYKRQPLYQ